MIRYEYDGLQQGPLSFVLRQQPPWRCARWSAFVKRLALFLQRHQTRRHLARLTVQQLEDIGINPEQAQTEAARPFWK